MGKTALQAFLGIIILIVGVYAGYIYIKGMNSHSSILLLVLSVFFTAFGLFFLFRAGRSNTTFGMSDSANNQPTVSEDAWLEKSLEKNNALINDWRQTNDKRERLKLLKLAGQSSE